MSIKYKIAFLFSLIVCIILSTVGLSIYFFSSTERTNTFRMRLKNRAISTAKINVNHNDTNYTLLNNINRASVASLFNKSITIINNKNEVIYKYSDSLNNVLLLDNEIIQKTKTNEIYYFTTNNRKAVAIYNVNSDENFIVAVAAVDADGEIFLLGLRKLLLLVLIVSVILSFFSGLFFANTIIKTIARIRSEVNLITSNNLSQRIQSGNSNDELYKLSQTFNDLLDRLQESFIIQRRFISNASHELSTPLTAISSQLEVILQKERTVEEYKEIIESVRDDVKELQLLTRSLLEIAKIGSEGSIDLNEVRIDEILLKAAADVQKINSRYKVSLNFEPIPEEEKLLTIFGNTNLLVNAFKNIIENGCKYSEDHHTFIQSTFNNVEVIISVNSKGDIIPESDLHNIFQPFFRTESAQQKQGFGLGLTFTKRILSIHKASIKVKSDSINGTVFSIIIPNKFSRG